MYTNIFIDILSTFSLCFAMLFLSPYLELTSF